MQYAICLQPYIPMRADCSERSEMVSQLLFGDTFEVLEEIPNWLSIRRDCDGYTGYIDSKTATELTAADYNEYRATAAEAPLLRLPYNTVSKTANGQSGVAHLSWGSRIYNIDNIGVTFTMQNQRFDIAPAACISPMNVSTMSHVACAKYLLQQASLLLNVPYLWGGCSAFGVDCSGFTQTLFRFIGIALPRDASQQYQCGKAVEFAELQCGDLAFFGREGRVSHVGLVAEKGQILHASGSLHFDNLKSDGIYSSVTGQQTHQLIGIKRLF